MMRPASGLLLLLTLSLDACARSSTGVRLQRVGKSSSLICMPQSLQPCKSACGCKRCRGWSQNVLPDLPRLRGGSNLDDYAKHALERNDHIAFWREERGGPHFDDIPTFRVLNPDPKEPWPPPQSDGARFGYGELFNQADYDNEAFQEEEKKELAESREQRAARRNAARSVHEMDYYDIKTAEGYDDPEAWLRDHVKGEDLESWRGFETFFKDVYPLRDPATAVEKDIDAYFNSTKEKKRTDDFPMLPIKASRALEKEIDDFDKAFPDAPTLLDESPIPRLVTWWHTMMGNYGYCFDLRARDADIVIHKLHGCSFTRQGPLHYKIWTTTGTWRYKCHSERLWTLIGEGHLELNFREGYYTELPLNQTVKIRGHSTQAFYIHTPDDDFGVGFRTHPMTALDDGDHCAPCDVKEEKDKGMAVDGVLYSSELAASGDIIERNRDLFVLTGAISPLERPFEEVSEAQDGQTGWCGMIDYTIATDG